MQRGDEFHWTLVNLEDAAKLRDELSRLIREQS